MEMVWIDSEMGERKRSDEMRRRVSLWHWDHVMCTIC